MKHIRNQFQISVNSVHFSDARFWSCHAPKKGKLWTNTEPSLFSSSTIMHVGIKRWHQALMGSEPCDRYDRM
jgi:hypothetical protein